MSTSSKITSKLKISEIKYAYFPEKEKYQVWKSVTKVVRLQVNKKKFLD